VPQRRRHRGAPIPNGGRPTLQTNAQGVPRPSDLSLLRRRQRDPADAGLRGPSLGGHHRRDTAGWAEANSAAEAPSCPMNPAGLLADAVRAWTIVGVAVAVVVAGLTGWLVAQGHASRVANAHEAEVALAGVHWRFRFELRPTPGSN